MMKTLYPVSSFDAGVRQAIQEVGGEIKSGSVLLPEEATITQVSDRSVNNGRYYTSVNDVQCGDVRFLHVLSESLSKLYLYESEEGQKYL